MRVGILSCGQNNASSASSNVTRDAGRLRRCRGPIINRLIVTIVRRSGDLSIRPLVGRVESRMEIQSGRFGVSRVSRAAAVVAIAGA